MCPLNFWRQLHILALFELQKCARKVCPLDFWRLFHTLGTFRIATMCPKNVPVRFFTTVTHFWQFSHCKHAPDRFFVLSWNHGSVHIYKNPFEVLHETQTHFSKKCVEIIILTWFSLCDIFTCISYHTHGENYIFNAFSWKNIHGYVFGPGKQNLCCVS